MSLWSCAVRLKTRQKGRVIVGSERGDCAVENGFPVTEHSTEYVDELGERGSDIVAATEPELRQSGTRCSSDSLTTPHALRRPAAPHRGKLEVASVCGAVMMNDGLWAYRYKHDAELIMMSMPKALPHVRVLQKGPRRSADFWVVVRLGL